MENRKTENDYTRYVQQMTDLCKGESDEGLKQALKERLTGGGPPLLRDEGDRIDVLILVYAGLKKQKDQKAVDRLRKSTVDLLMEYLRKYKTLAPADTIPVLEQVDFLGHLVAWFEIKEDPGLSVELADKLLGFLNRLKVPMDLLMDLDGMALETSVRAFDLWLAATSWNDAFKWPNHLQLAMENLYKNNLEKLKKAPHSPIDTTIRLLFLSFRAVLRANPYWMGQQGLQMMSTCLNRLSQYSDKTINQWWGLCHDLNVVFRKKKEWQKNFIKGITSIKDIKNQDIYFDELPSTIQESLRCLGLEKEAVEKLGISRKTIEERIEPLVEKLTLHEDFTGGQKEVIQ
jgi:hypothetical protein